MALFRPLGLVKGDDNDVLSSEFSGHTSRTALWSFAGRLLAYEGPGGPDPEFDCERWDSVCTGSLR